jgi:uncharacterized protein (DUF2141 family)
MTKNRFHFLLVVLAAVIVISFSGGGCANQIAPTGGPKDTLPPVLVMATPRDSSFDFTAKKIVFNFNEYVETQNIQENLIVSPVPKINPVVESKLRTVTVKIKDTLEPNTTYTFDFGNAIKDINEGNVAKNFTYVFSTGRTIDSFELGGKVLLAETGKADSTLTVMLHRSQDDSAVIKERPRYITRVNAKGNFLFRNLPAGTFAIYALKDEGGQHKYLSPKQLFAFAGKPVTTGGKYEPVTLYAFLEKQKEPEKQAPVKKAIKVSDKKKEQDKLLHFRNNLQNGQQDLLDSLELSFAEPLKTLDTTKIRFSDTAFKPLTGYQLIEDSFRQKITLIYTWKENTAYNLVLDKDFAADTSGRKIPKTDTLGFKTMKFTDYGSVHIRFNNLDTAKRPVLQLFQGEELKFTQKIRSKDINVKLFKPGEYAIRILLDDNDNGAWDTGDFFGNHLQPEKVIPVDKKLTVKANWDNDLTLEL